MVFTASFLVSGNPKAQPRAKARYNKALGRAGVYDEGTANGWKALVVMAWEKVKPPAPLKGPIHLLLEFRVRRGKSHFGSGKNAEVLKDSAPKHPLGRPDCDNLAKAVMDALSDAMAWDDDAQVVRLTVVKMYETAERGRGCCIILEETS